MKSFIRFFVSLLIVAALAPAQQKSDYATVKRFQELTKSITKATEEAKTVQECAAVAASIDELGEEFRSEKPLLDKALYPDDFLKTFDLLRGRLMIRQKDLGVIESQFVRISELETQVRELSGQVEKLNGENSKLMSEIEGLKGNIEKIGAETAARTTLTDSLKGVITKLQQQLKDRDQLIFALVDSLFLQYDKNVADMKDVEKQGLSVKLERHGVFSNIKRSLEDNLKFLETTSLKGNDLVKVVQQQQRFQSQWKGLRPKFTAVYAGGKKKFTDVADIDELLIKWAANVDLATWRSLNQLMKDYGITIKEFTNGQEFITQLMAFIDEQIQNPKKDADDVRLKLFLNFEENLWKGELGSSWIPALAEVGKITVEQKNEITAKVDQWKSEVSPAASWLTYVLILLGVALVVLIAVRYFQKGKK